MGVRIFISYRREDTEVYAQSLAMELQHHFEEGEIFIDRTELEPGDEWPEEINEALTEAELVLVLIGTKWLKVTGPDGKRRLDDPDDVLLREVRTALDRKEDGVRVIPVLLNGAAMPKKKNLPEDLADLTKRQAASIRDNLFLKETRELVAFVKKVLHPEKPVRVRKALTELKRRTRLRRWAVATAACLGLLAFVALWTGQINYRAAEVWTMERGDREAKKQFSKDIQLVTADGATAEVLIDPDKDTRTQWRERDSKLITKLSRAGAKVIALDMIYEMEHPADTHISIAAQQAEERGSIVLVAGQRFAPGKAPVSSNLSGVTGWGNAIVEKPDGIAYGVPLAVWKREIDQGEVKDPTNTATPGKEGKGVVIPSFALHCFAAFDEDYSDHLVKFRFNPAAFSKQVSVELTGDGSSRITSFTCYDVDFSVAESEKNAKKIRDAEDAVGILALDLSPLEAIEAQTTKYESVLTLSDREATARFSGKIVLVGEATGNDEHYVHGGNRTGRRPIRPVEEAETASTTGGTRWGVELHADALNSLLSGKSIHAPSGPVKMVLTIGLFILGAIIWAALVRFPSYWQWAALLVLIFTYYRLSMFFYDEYRVILSFLDGTLAFSLSFLLVGVLRKRIL